MWRAERCASTKIHPTRCTTYSLAGNPGLHIVTPIEWNELADVDNGTYTALTSAKRLERDVFAELAAAIGEQRFSAVR
jgi:DNA primase